MIGGIHKLLVFLSNWCDLMQVVASRSSPTIWTMCEVVFCVLGVCLVVVPEQSAAENGLPPVRNLIAETSTLCNVDREENKSALNDLAAAQCYLGEFAAARKNLLPYGADDIFQQSAHQACAQIEIEITGLTAAIPKELWNDDFGGMHCYAALAFIERGEIDKALQQIAGVPRDVYSGFSVFGPKLIQKLKARKEHDACHQVLLQWAKCYEKTGSVSHYRDSHRVSQLVAWLVEFQEKAAATALCERWHAVVQAETDIDRYGESIGRTWAGYALAMHALGDKDAASRALDEANHWMDQAWTASKTSIERLKNFDFACAYAAIAARRAIVLGVDNSVAAMDHAIELARMSVNPDWGEYAFEKVVVEQLNAGDTAGARETIKLISQPRTIGRAWKVICMHDRENGEVESARLAARSAVLALDKDGFEPFMAQEMAPVAMEAALAGERELAQRLMQRAVELSTANETPKFNHPWIAGIQVNAGLLEDAYRVIQAIEEPADRTRPLSQLCRAMAKGEYEAKRGVREQN